MDKSVCRPNHMVIVRQQKREMFSADPLPIVNIADGYRSMLCYAETFAAREVKVKNLEARSNSILVRNAAQDFIRSMLRVGRFFVALKKIILNVLG